MTRISEKNMTQGLAGISEVPLALVTSQMDNYQNGVYIAHTCSVEKEQKRRLKFTNEVER